MINVRQIKNSQICYEANPSHYIAEYYNYCLGLIQNELHRIEIPLNIIFGNLNWNFDNQNRVLKIDIQYEHTLVREGGRSVDKKYIGSTPTGDGDYYLVRIDRFDYLNGLDIVIEYSVPNMVNISESGYFNDFFTKLTNIAPLIYDDLNLDATHKKHTITLFSNNASPRRANFTNIVEAKKINCININNCFTASDLKNVYEASRIMVNVHQTDHHHTLEELRVLPAILNGVIVISEEVPLVEKIPYGDSIVWSTYENLAETTLEVQNNYEHFYQKIFTDKLSKTLLSLKQSNVKSLNDTIRNHALGR